MLTVIVGPMFSGKTSKLQSIYSANIIAKNRVIAFKPSNDTRHSDITSHDGIKTKSFILNKDYPLSSYIDWAKHKHKDYVLFFDECQFFHKGDFGALVKMLISAGKSVFCAGLSCDSYGEQFGAMGALLATADHIIINKAVCARCRGIGIATRTYRKTKNKEQVVVGGADIYEPRCFKCWRINE